MKDNINTIINVGTAGYVQLIDYMGSDELISQIAGISYLSEKGPGAEKLLKMEHKSPFEFGEIIFKIKCPIFVIRHIVRHRTASLMEKSMRYVEAKNIQFWFPDEARLKELDAEEILSIFEETYKYCQDSYNRLRVLKAPRELARVVIPPGVYTELYWKMDVRNLLNFLDLRDDGHAQKETRDFAVAISKFIETIFPKTYETYYSLREKK